MTVLELLKKSWSLRRNVVDIIMAGGVSYGSLGMSLAWGLNGQVNYVLEGNLNYTGGGHHVAERGRLPHRFGQRERAACAAGFSCGLYDPEMIFANTHRSCFTPEMDNTEREARYNGWQKAVRQALTH